MKKIKSYKLFFIIITIFLIVINISTVKAYVDKNSEEYKLREEEAKQIINSANPYPSSTVENNNKTDYKKSTKIYDKGNVLNIFFSVSFLIILIILLYIFLFWVIKQISNELIKYDNSDKISKRGIFTGFVLYSGFIIVPSYFIMCLILKIFELLYK